MMVSRFSAFGLLALGVGLCLAWSAPASAQDVVSQPVVQPLPSTEVQRLNRALVALAKSPQDRDSLIEAGQAALGIDDLEAAIGFFGRAAEVDPGHPGAAQGLGSVYLRAGRAGEALVQFDRALASGADERGVLTDRALTLDLVGENAVAQASYMRALELDPGNDEARRRLAVSHAITGNRARFEDTLRPLLDRRDVAAQRARAFGLAIMGDTDRAGAIVEQVMPRDIATRPQQAAAANLGIFPRAADIGRDDPRLARFAVEERADSRLAPAGAPLGSRPAPVPVPVSVPTPPPSTTVYAEPVAASVIGSGATPAAARVATVAPVAVSAAPPPPASAPAAAAAPASVPRPSIQTLRVADAFADLGAPPRARLRRRRRSPSPPKSPSPRSRSSRSTPAACGCRWRRGARSMRSPSTGGGSARRAGRSSARPSPTPRAGGRPTAWWSGRWKPATRVRRWCAI